MNSPLANSRFASIDIGSHTIRLLIAGIEREQNVIPLQLERRITRLAKDFLYDETLKEPGMEKSIEVLKEYSGFLNRQHVHFIHCGATGVIRRAKNRQDFLNRIYEATGIRVSILSEESEASISAKGALSALPHQEGFSLTFDLGGSSTEFLLIDSHQNIPLWVTSVFVGAATLTERHLFGDPPERTALVKAREAIRSLLSPVLEAIRGRLDSWEIASPPFRLVGTAGTVTTLAAMNLKMTDYDPYRVNGLELSENWLSNTINLLAGMPFHARRSIPGLEKGREDIILGGALIVHEILTGLGKERFIVTDAGLLEGLVLDITEKQLGHPPTFSSPLTWNIQKG